jgi:hypothetical protein
MLVQKYFSRQRRPEVRVSGPDQLDRILPDPFVPAPVRLPASCLMDQPGTLRLRRAHMRFQDQMRHLSLREQVNHLNLILRDYYAYYGVNRAEGYYWRKMLSSFRLSLHAGVVMTALKLSAALGTCDRAMKEACSTERSAAKYSWNWVGSR